MRDTRVGEGTELPAVPVPPLSLGKARTTLLLSELGVIIAPHLSADLHGPVQPTVPYAAAAAGVTVLWPQVTWLAELAGRVTKKICLYPVDKGIKFFMKRSAKIRAEEERENGKEQDSPDELHNAAEATEPQPDANREASAPKAAQSAAHQLRTVPLQVAGADTPAGVGPGDAGEA
ncbi:hypothetical protein ACFCYF_41860 [Streptomyces chartreusis]|uniref:hypothetical protein n=1 Tax=Streptomyces chartreusis TaxID=1969 RepID=UPI0035DA7A3E